MLVVYVKRCPYARQSAMRFLDDVPLSVFENAGNRLVLRSVHETPVYNR